MATARFLGIDVCKDWLDVVGTMRARSLLGHELTNARAPGPATVAFPRCETSKMPTASRTAACSLSTPPPLAVYSIGISQPPKSASLAPSA